MAFAPPSHTPLHHGHSGRITKDYKPAQTHARNCSTRTSLPTGGKGSDGMGGAGTARTSVALHKNAIS